MTAPDTNDDLIARCLRFLWAIERDNLRGLLDEAQAEIERLRGHDSKCESFFVEGAYAYTPCSCAERLALAELHRLRAKVKQGDALAAALRNVRRYVLSADMDYPQVDAALAAWEDTPGGDDAS